MGMADPWNDDNQQHPNVVPFPRSDDGSNDHRKDQAMPTGDVQCEIEKGTDHVKLIIGVGRSKITYKMSPSLAKEIGEEMFKQACNIPAAQAG